MALHEGLCVRCICVSKFDLCPHVLISLAPFLAVVSVL